MKRVTALSILLALCLTLSGCGGSTQNADEAPPPDDAGETTTETVSETAANGLIPILDEKTAAPFSIGAERIGLPTGGAEIDSVMFVKDVEGTLPTGDFYRVNGRIRPVDPDAPDIL